MRMIIDIDEKYADALSVTAVGCSVFQTVVVTHAVDLSKCNHMILGADGKFVDCEKDND